MRSIDFFQAMVIIGPSALAVVLLWTIHLGPQSRNCYQLLNPEDALWLGQGAVALRGMT